MLAIPAGGYISPPEADGLGNVVSVLNVAAICGVVGITGREGDLLRKAIVPMALFALFAGLFGMLLSYLLVPGLF
jgi:lactate permease